MIKLITIIMMASSFQSFGAVSFKAIGGKRLFHSYKEVCKEFGLKDLLLTSADGLAKVDCMAKKVLITDFCLKKYKSRTDFLRGRVDKIEDQVMCEFAKAAKLKIFCDGKATKYCIDPKKQCEKLRRIYAYQLELSRASSVDGFLNCYYSAVLSNSKNELLQSNK